MLTQMGFDCFGYTYTITGLSAICLNTLLFALIVFATPEAMDQYKWFLANLTLADFFFSFYVDFMLRPVILTTGITVMITGFLADLAFPQHLARYAALVYLVLLTWSLFSMLLCFIYRYAFIVRNRFGRFLLRPAGYSLSVGIGIAACLITAISAGNTMESDYSAILARTLQLEPNLTRFVSNVLLIAIIANQNTSSSILNALSVLGAIIFVIVVIGCAISMIHSLRACRSSMTSATYKLQKQLTIALFVQCLYPIALIAVPTALASIYQLTHWPAFLVDSDSLPLLPLAIIFALTTFPSCNALSTIVFVTAYRRAIRRRCLCVSGFLSHENGLVRKKSITVISVNESRK